MPKLKCLCKNEYTVTAKEAEGQVACPACGWSLEPHEIPRYIERAGGSVAEKTPETPPEPSPAPEPIEDVDSANSKNGD